MNNPLLDRMKSRQRARRLDTAQRYGMVAFIVAVICLSIYELVGGMWA